MTPELRTAEGTYRAGIAVTVGVVAVQFLSYLWGGYTAGRMARGAGAVNGLLVPLVMLVLGTAALAVGASIGSGAEVNFGSLAATLPVDRDVVVDAGMAMAAGSLLAMLLGGIIGGALGQRWHTRLEQRELSSVMVEDRGIARTPDRPVDTATATTGPLAVDGHRAEADGRPDAVEGVTVLGPDAGVRTIDLRDSDPDETVEAAVERERGRTSV